MKEIFVKIGKGVNLVLSMIINRVLRIFTKLEKNKVLFLSDVREGLGGNLELVYNMLPSDIYNKKVSLKSDRRAKRTLNQKKELMLDLATSEYIILEDLSRATIPIKLRKGQQMCQLWHAPGAFKKFGYSRKDIRNVHPAYKRYTKAIVSSKSIEGCYAEAFGIDKEKVKATGVPRTDMFFNKQFIKEKKDQLYKEYPNLVNKKVILFAPTYRGKPFSDEATFDFSTLDLDKIYEKFKDKYIFVFKWHPAIYNNIQRGISKMYDLSKYNGFYADMSEYRDINDLLLVTDILVTDYSSVIFDYLLVNKPVVYFTYDLEDYKQGRGLYYDFEEYVYGEVTKNTDELIEEIAKENMMDEKRKVFNEKFMSACDGKATEKTVNWIFGK